MLNIDRKLVKGLHKNDPEALRQLFNKYHHALYYHALDFLKSPQQAEDAVQEVFVKIWVNRQQIKLNSPFKAYLFCITKNLVINQLRRASREMKAMQDITYRTVTHCNHTEEQVIYSEYELIAQKALDKLSPKRKKVFTLHRLEGRKYDEIAVLMSISKNTVRDHVVKAEKSIKKYFAFQAGITLPLWLALVVYLHS